MKSFTVKISIAVCTFFLGLIAVTLCLINPLLSPVAPIDIVGNYNFQESVVPSQQQSVINNISDTKILCNRVSEIKILPYAKESGEDDAYDALIEGGDAVIPCLIEKITDTTVMNDPRGTIISRELKVGDVAYFVLTDITQIDFCEMLPSKVQEKFKTEGAYAYHDYIERKGNRKQLKKKLRKWYEANYGQHL